MANKSEKKISQKADRPKKSKVEKRADSLHKRPVRKHTEELKVTNDKLKKKIAELKRAQEEIKRFASFPQLNPNPVLEIDSSGTIVFCNAATVQALRKLNLRDTTIFLPNDVANILNALEQEKDVQFYREVKIKDRIFGEVLCLTPQFDSIRIYANDITERKSYQEVLKNAVHELRQQAESLRHSEEYFRLLMENASDTVTILEGDGTIRYESLSVERMLGYKPEELVGTSVFDLIHPDDLSDVTNIFSQGVKNPGIVLSAQFRSKHKDGSWRFLDVIGKNLLDNPTISGIVINARDITESNQAEEAVRSERQKLINILDSMVDGVYIVDQKYNIEYVNPEIEKEYGPVNGRSCHEYFEGRKKACTWCRNQEVFEGKTVRWEWYLEKTNKTYDLINTPLKNPDGSVSKLGIFRDITERKQAEEALRESEEKFKTIFDGSIDGILVADEENKKFLMGNKAICNMLGYNEDEIKNLSVMDIHPKEDLPFVEKEFEKTARQETFLNDNIPIKRKDGSVLYVDITASHITLSGKKYVVGSFRDITERKQADVEKQLLLNEVQAERDKLSAFVNSISDEIWLCDTNKKFTLMNPSALREFGLVSDEVDAEKLAASLEVYRPDGSPRPVEEAPPLRALKGEVVRNLEEIILTPASGELRYRQVNASPVRDSNGNIMGSVSVVRDITERMHAENLLRESESKYRSLFTNMTNGFAFHKVLLNDIGKPCDYVFLEVNDAFEHLTGLSRENVIGKRVTEVIPHIEDEPADWIGIYGKVALSGAAIHFESYAAALKKWYSVSAYSPAKEYFAVTFEDITDRKQRADLSEGLNRINEIISSTLNPDEIMRMVIEEAAKTIGCETAGIAARQDGHWIPKYTYLFPLQVVGMRFTDQELPEVALAAKIKKPVVINDTFNDERVNRRIMEKYGVRSVLALPLISTLEEEVLGVIGFNFHSAPSKFTNAQIDFATKLGVSVSLALEKAKLYSAEKDARRLSDALNYINTLIGSTLDTNEIMQRIVTEAARAIGAETTGISLREKGHWLVKYIHGLPEEAIGLKLTDEENPHGFLAISKKEVIAIDNAFDDLRVNREIMQKYGIHSVLVIPLLIKEKPTGAIFFNYHSFPVKFTDAQIDFAGKLGASLSLALENSKLFEELELRVQERTVELKKTVDALHDEIEERISAEETIKEQSDILDSLFKDTLTPLVLLDPDFNFIRVNEAYARACRKDVSEFMGHNHFEFFPHEENEAIFRKTVEARFPYHAIAKPFVYPDHPESGVTYWDWTLTPLLDEYGEVKFLVFSLNDVTERKRSDDVVKAERQRLYSVLENIPAYVSLLTPDYTFAYVNQEFKNIFGDPGERKCHEFLFNCQEPCVGCQTYKIFTEHKSEQKWEWVGPNGNIYDIYDYAFTDVDGSPLILEMGLDITERKKALERISFTSKLLELFVTKPTRKEYLDSAVDLLLDWTNCNCIGIRVLDKLGNIPYESYKGFSQEFWEAENWISVKNHTCACIRVVLQKPDPQEMNMLTPNGSFHCNDSEEFATLLTEKELSRYRGLCIRTGYKSIAIIPIRYKDTVLGALHIADKREGMVPLEKVEFIESVSPLIGEAIFRFTAEEALVKSEARLSEAQRIALLGNWEWDIGNDVVSLSDELYRIFAVEPEKFIPTYQSFLNFVYPDDLNNLKTAIEEAVRKKIPFNMDFRFLTADGHVRFMHTRGQITYDLSGRPFLVRGIGQDITDRVKAEKALRESEERYRMLIETMNEGLGMDNENGLLVYANERLCEMLGYSLNEMIGRPVVSFLDEKNQKIIQEQIEKRKSGEEESYRLEWIRKDGNKIITFVSPRAIFNQAGQYKGSFAVITDITEKLRLESIAEAVNTMENISFIFSGVRHEIGNPVNSIKMALSVLKKNIDSYSIDKIKEYADRMIEEISRMEYLLKAMKNFNMYETVHLVDTDMTDFMKNFLALVTDDFTRRGIRIETVIPETVWAYADPRALQQVLLNIMTNAADSFDGREAPRIEISVSNLAGMVNIRIEDNGCGMTEQQQEDLFKPFYTTKAKGTGLGLVITKKMITKMKGVIEVVSEKNKGTIVDLFIPEGINE